jgi:hypothetical protein
MFIAQLAVSALIEHQYSGDRALLEDRQTLARWVFAAIYAIAAVALLIVQRRDVRVSFGVAIRRIRAAFTFGARAEA